VGAGTLTNDGDSVWLRTADERFLVRLDAEDGTPVEGIVSDQFSIGDALVAFGSVWTSLSEEETLLRVGYD
jgi:hypothetical protein